MQLRGNLIHRLPDLNIDNDKFDTRKIETSWGSYTEIKTSTNCCFCAKPMWAEVKRESNWVNGYKVIDPRAYPDDRTPDYTISGKDLYECHNECYPGLLETLSHGEKPNPSLFINNNEQST